MPMAWKFINRLGLREPHPELPLIQTHLASACAFIVFILFCSLIAIVKKLAFCLRFITERSTCLCLTQWDKSIGYRTNTLRSHRNVNGLDIQIILTMESFLPHGEATASRAVIIIISGRMDATKQMSKEHNWERIGWPWSAFAKAKAQNQWT